MRAWTRSFAACAVTALCALAAPAQAQERRGGPPGDFDFYVLALSWSPSFCSGGGGMDRGAAQCEPGRGQGFVVHGLWPQFTRGFPSECGMASRAPSRIAMEGARGVFPDEGLARYEWRKHGTCSGLSPSDYFSAVRRARDAVKIPKPFAEPRSNQRWTTLDLERAFVAINPGLRVDEMAVACKSGALQEIRICFSKDLREFQPCPQVNQSGCRAREISVPPPL
jgi:ribonuclease T2